MHTHTDSIRSNDSEQIAELQQQLARAADERAALAAELRLTRAERDLLKERLMLSLRRLFAAKSEARGTDQKDLFFNEAEAAAPDAASAVAADGADASATAATDSAAAADTNTATVMVPTHQRNKPGRKPINPALPRAVIRHELPEAERRCPHDGATLNEIGVQSSEQLDIVPAQLRVIRHERVTYACPCCDQTIRTAPRPVPGLAKELLTAAAQSWVISAKYVDGMPLYRTAAHLNRISDGAINRHTLAGCAVRRGQDAQPLVNLMRDRLFDAPLIAGDETVVQVLKEPGRAAQAKSFMWVQASGGLQPHDSTGPPIRLFHYEPSRSAETAQRLYAGIGRGTALITDGYAVYDEIAQTNHLVPLGCWAHARRRLVEAEAALPQAARVSTQVATQFISAIGELYALEKRATENNATTDERLQLRQQHSRVVLARIEALLLKHLHAVLPGSLLGKALHYLSNQWPKLTRFVNDARYPLDNNVCENAIRPFVIGRRNWLFADTQAGATASANLYSVIETAKANGVDPSRYLTWLFTHLPAARTADDYERLLPWRFSDEHQTP